MQVAAKGIVPLGHSGRVRESADSEPARAALTVNVSSPPKMYVRNLRFRVKCLMLAHECHLAFESANKFKLVGGSVVDEKPCCLVLGKVLWFVSLLALSL